MRWITDSSEYVLGELQDVVFIRSQQTDD